MYQHAAVVLSEMKPAKRLPPVSESTFDPNPYPKKEEAESVLRLSASKPGTQHRRYL